MLALTLLWIFAVPTVELFSVSLHPKRAIWRVGDRQVLRCSALDCAEEALFSWSLLEDKPSYTTTLNNASESVLVFDPVVPAHENSILCKVRCGGESKKNEKEQRAKITVYSLPTAPVISGNMQLRGGEIQSVTCEVSDAHPQEYIQLTWLQGDRLLHEDIGDMETKSTVSSKFTFTPSPEDNGRPITCRAWNTLEGVPEDQASKESTETLTVLYAPRDVKTSETTAVAEGGSFSLTCEADGNPKPEVLWRKLGGDGQSVAEWSSERLTVHSVTPSHAGDYECVLRNVIGYSTKRVGVVVQAHPRNTSIMVSPDSDLKEGDSVTISCVSDAVPVDRLVLFRVSEGQRVELQSGPASSVSITLSSVKLSDSVLYECEASNQYGRQSASTMLNITTFEVQLIPGDGVVTVEKGSNLTLFCTATGCPAPAFFWKSRLDGPVHSRRENGGYSSTLFLSPKELVYDTAYTCEVHCDSTKRFKHTEIKLFYFPTDPMITAPAHFVEDQLTVLNCSVPSVSPASLLHIEWLRGDGSVLPGSYSTTSFTSTLDFELRAENHGERITCRATLDMENLPMDKRQRSASIVLNLVSLPKNTSISVSPSGDLKEGDSVTVTCMSQAEAVNRLVLYRVSEGQRVELQSGSASVSVTLSSVRLSDSGLYECEASSQYGRQRAGERVVVRAPPRNTTVQAFPSLQVEEGQNITICCRTVSFPPSAVTLRKLDGSVELYSPNGTFLLLNLTTDDAGLYQVNVTNGLGYDTEIFTISVIEKPFNSSPRWEEFILPAVGLVTIVTTASLIIHYLRMARMKGSYELARSTPGTA